MKKAQIKELKEMMQKLRMTQDQEKKLDWGNEIITYLAACLDGIKEKV